MHRRPHVLVTSIALLLAPATVRARPAASFLADGSLGVDLPFAGAPYRDSFYPSPTLGLTLGAEVWLSQRIGLAPAFSIDGGPLLPRRTSAVSTGHARLAPALRLLFDVGHGRAVFVQWLLGLDTFIYGPGGTLGAGKFDLGVAVDAGVGMQFRFRRHLAIGFIVGVPVAVHDPFDTRPVDAGVDLRFFVGRR
jgi:hypothetical protein